MAAKKKTGKAYGNKTKFVLSLPRDMPAKQVVDKAKQQGVVLSEAHVYKIRSTNKPNGASGKAAPARSTPSAKGASAAMKPGMSKRDFVLSFPAGTSASEILRKAKETGIGLSKAYLYTVRNAAGTPRGAGRAGAGARVGMGRGAARAGGSLEAQFVDAALDLGLARAAELLDQVRARIKSSI